MNMIQQAINEVQKGLDHKNLSEEATENLTRKLDFDFYEHSKFQELKSLAFASELINLEEAQLLYTLLGPTATHVNSQSVAVKIALTVVMEKLIQVVINI